VTTQAERGEQFAALHEGEPFLIPNPWDAGSAKVLAGLGFKALATTSSGFAYTLGRRDGGATLDEVAAHVRLLADATPLPVSVDLESGHGDAAAAIARIAEAGAVGGSIEDYDRDAGIVPLDEAVERVAAAVEAARALPFRFTLTARAENHIHGRPDLGDTISRLRSFAEAGADVLYAPGLRSPEEIGAVCSAVSKPVNVLALPGMTFGEIVRAGAQRVSVGGGLAWVAADALIEAATTIRDSGDFSVLRVSRSPREWLG
jgi:2-methylisocitrate lyase-like PEP mutase family enzyme